MTLSKKLLLLSALMLASTPFLSAQATPAVPPGAAFGTPEQVRQMLQNFHAARQVILAQRMEIVRALQAVSEEDRKAIIAELRAMQKDLSAEHRALARTIREEMKQLRDQRRNPPTG
jgi:Skp family chaperone for outer membrane proteins